MDGCFRFNGLGIHAPLLYQLHTRESAAIDRLIKFKINYFKTHAAFFHKRWKQRSFEITIYTIKEWWQQNEQARSLNKIYNRKCKFNYILLKTTHLLLSKSSWPLLSRGEFFKLFVFYATFGIICYNTTYCWSIIDVVIVFCLICSGEKFSLFWSRLILFIT